MARRLSSMAARAAGGVGGREQAAAAEAGDAQAVVADDLRGAFAEADGATWSRHGAMP